METAKITVKSQVTIPRGVREKLGLACGDRIAFEPAPDGRFIVAKAAPIRRSDGAARKRLGTAAKPPHGNEASVISRMIAEDDIRIRRAK